MRRAMTTGLIGLAILLRDRAARVGAVEHHQVARELSGPGYFVLYGGEVHVGCKFDKAIEESPPRRDRRSARAVLRPESDGCGFESCVGKDPLLLGSPGRVGYGSNPLGVPRGREKGQDSAWTLSAGPVYRLGSAADVGTSLGFAHFAGSTVKSTTKVVIDPYVVIRPLVKWPDDLKQYFSVRINASMFPQGFTQEDFGATAGIAQGRRQRSSCRSRSYSTSPISDGSEGCRERDDVQGPGGKTLPALLTQIDQAGPPTNRLGVRAGAGSRAGSGQAHR
jgi:hypothetical protein